MSEDNAKLFISYSWTDNDHEKWVLNLATELRENGVEVILDKWDLKEGHDSYAFMEKMVTDPDIKKVILVCDKEYAEKADNRAGGVGTETQIITPELYSEQEQDRFVAVVTEKDEDGNPYLPTFYKSRIYIDLSTDEIYASNFEQLLRWIYDHPLHIKPDIGKKPTFLSDETHINLGIDSKHRRAISAIKDNKDGWKGDLKDLFDTINENLEKFRMDTAEGEIDENVLNSISEFTPYRNKLIQLFSLLARYKNEDQEAFEIIHQFFEGLLVYIERPESMMSYREWDFDNYKFIVHELFLYANACFLKNHAFGFTNYLLSNWYYFDRAQSSKSDLYHYRVFRSYLKSIEEYRKNRIDTNRISIHADLLKSRSEGSGVSFQKLMETDFILFLKSSFDTLKQDKRLTWYPISLVYSESIYSSFELFTRSKSQAFFNDFKKVLGIEEKDELSSLIESFKTGDLNLPRWDYRHLNIEILSGVNEIAEIA